MGLNDGVDYLEYSLKKCIGCEWRGVEARLVKCSECDESYFVCPKCGRPVVDICEKPFLYTTIDVRQVNS